ncbi:response regulator transcription factor [Embleya hyalina]|uniref:DNA-binding response regulator n=1 Tax=Embleya hyalina TaxID=516124 RepID=A0A401YQT4_9ACTN|nr:response regulator transcription factor [Embleya hyalina]GCD96951.1 DNA-binding response regulator [Embleya hyalina]
MRVLVVQDGEHVADALRRGLEGEGYVVDAVSDGVDAVWLGRENPYDAIILDVELPGLDGYRVCSTLRDDGVWTPILILTARSGERDEVQGLDQGADDYLTKPFSFAVLVARLRALMRRGAPERPAVLVAGDLSLDPATRCVRRGDTLITLTGREFSLLEFLLRRRGQGLSKREILRHVWGDDFEGATNLVEVYVRRLRNKLDRPFDRAAIETLPDRGYRLAVDGG